MRVLMNVRVYVQGWCLCNILWRHGNVWLPGGMAPESYYVDFLSVRQFHEFIHWNPNLSKYSSTPNISQWVYVCICICMYIHIYIPIYIHVYIFISWSQDDAPWLVQIGEVLVYPCEFVICRTRLIFSFVLCYHWSESVVVPIGSSSLVALEFVRMTTSSAAGGGNFVGMASFLLRCNYHDMYDREISGSL